MKSSGVSRFLTRRDKHHEKRSSKTLPNSNVRLHSSASCSSLTPLLHRPDSSDLVYLQPHASHHVSPNLYTIFTNEKAHTAADKDADKQVRRPPRTLHWPLY
jgi:hypothetical protein